jgi:predicted ATP-dependent endonuclease of OLD family
MLKNISLRFKYSHLVNIMEEPELNLYPASQKSEIEALVKLNNSNPKNRLVITTHSPYVLTTFNNLLYAGMLASQYPNEIEKIITKDLWIEKGKLSAFEIIDGKVKSIIDKETGLIQAEMIDKISNQINKDFESLLEYDKSL